MIPITSISLGAKDRLRTHPTACTIAVGLIVAIVATAIETFRLRYANYLVYSDSTLLFWRGISPYTPDFVADHGRYFLYPPVFSVLYWPIAILPKWLGPFVWNLTNFSLFTLSVFTLPSRYDAHKLKIYLFLLLVLEQSVFPFQFNIVVAYCFLFAYNLLERGHGMWAVLLIMLSATTKVYGVVQLLMLFCYRHTFKHLCWAAVCGVLFLLLPAIKVGFGGLAGCYLDWWNMLAIHQSADTYASLLYAWPLNKVLDHYRVVQLVTLAFVVGVFFVQHRRWGEFEFRATALGVLMGWIIVLGDSSEIHTYLIALSGYMLWYWLRDHHSTFDKVLLWALVVFFGIMPVDLFVPARVNKLVNGTFFIAIYLYAIVWCQMCWSLMRRRQLSACS